MTLYLQVFGDEMKCVIIDFNMLWYNNKPEIQKLSRQFNRRYINLCNLQCIQNQSWIQNRFNYFIEDPDIGI